MTKKITVTIDQNDWPSCMTFNPENWSYWVYRQLSAAGMPVSPSGDVLSGVVTRRYDPSNFGATIYEWAPDNEASNK